MPNVLYREDDIGFREEYIECACFSAEHVIRIVYYVEPKTETIDTYDGIYIEVQMSPHREFFKRLILAFKYLFRISLHSYESYWSGTAINVEEAKKIKTLLEKFIKDDEDSKHK